MKNYILLLSIPILIIIFIVSPFKANFSTLPLYMPIVISIIISIIFLFIAYKKPIAGSQFVTVLFLLGILLRIMYLSDTPYQIRTHDVQSHIDYIQYISKNHSLPPANGGWEYYQPPLYYLAVSPVCIFTSCQGNNLILLQTISLLAFLGFLYFSIKLLRLHFPPEFGEKYFNIASALLIFWPAGIISSVAIGNDVFLYLFIAGGLYFITKWFIDGNSKNMLLAILFSIFSLVTKSNGIILSGIICFAVLLRFILKKNKKELFFNSLKLSLLIIFILFLAHLKIVQNNNVANIKDLMVANVSGLSSQLAVGNNINNYVFFDIKDFLNVPYTSPWSDVGGRQYFSNYFLKTSIFGEFNFWQNVLKRQAIFINYLLFSLLIIITLGILLVIAESFNHFNEIHKKISPYILIAPTILLFVSALICLRYLIPFACSGDFRYIYPITIPISIVAGYVIYILNKYGLTLKANRKVASQPVLNGLKFIPFFAIANLAEIIIYVFIIASALFFISMVIL